MGNANSESRPYKQVYISPEAHSRLQELAERQNRALGAQVEWLIDQELLRQNRDQQNSTPNGVGDNGEPEGSSIAK